ncbi:MAG: phenylalanine--tRNA ligase subunit beta [Bacillota bacterium]|nr:phenylalanine--tRNA ligase subunit beta [Bacillota bacterium]
MRVPVFWLRELVDDLPDVETLAQGLTMGGLPVEGVEVFGEGVRGVVAGRILELRPLPGSEHLQVCRVDRGGVVPVEIVTGAPNVAAGQTVPVALPGSVLAGGRRMGAAEFRGVRSEGMLCSAVELGISTMEGDGLLVLPEPVEPGTDLGNLLHLGEKILELELTANRSDCLSMAGVAREVAAIFGCPLRLPSAEVEEGEEEAGDLASLVVLDPDGCPRYVARLLLGAAPGPSPLWMQQRLRAAGLRPITNLVDVTNYVMLELGQPLHAFDLDRLAGQRIVVRRAGMGETLVTLDETERRLDPTDLVIADAERAVAVAGVMGGAGSEISAGTRRVLLESACFNPTLVRRTAKRLGMRSEASSRFERGVDPNLQALAADRAAQLMREVAGATVARGRLDFYPVPVPPRRIEVRAARVNALLGTTLSGEEIAGCLKRLVGVTVSEQAEGVYAVTVPTYRRDLEQEVDLVEEVARLQGYDAIPSTLRPGLSVEPPRTDRQRVEERVRQALMASGLSEAVTSSLVARDNLQLWGVPEGSPLSRAVELMLPLSEGQAVLRTSLLPSLGEVLRRNLSRRLTDVRIFEVGTVFWPQGEGELPREPRLVAGLLTGQVGGGEWWSTRRTADFFDAKGAVEAFLSALGIAGYEFRPATRAGFHPGRCAELVVDGEVAGVVGEVHPEVQAALEAPDRVAVFEVNLEVVGRAAVEPLAFRPLPRFPAVGRDLAFSLPADVTARAVEAAIREAGGELLEQVRLFDVYTGGNLPAGRRSLAFALSFRAPDRTLTDTEVDAVVAGVVNRLEQNFGARLRR